MLQVHPTRHCNIACAHCYSSSGPDARDGVPFTRLAACLEDACALGYRQLAVSGGEPLLYPALAGLLAKARAFGMITSVTSNGLLLTPGRWAPLAPLVDVLAISIDGTPAEHDLIRRRDGAFTRTIDNLQVIRASAVPFGFIFTLTRNNADSLEFVVRLAAEQGARSVQVHPLTLHGRAATEMAEARPDGIEIAAALLEGMRLGRALGIAVHVDALTTEQLFAFRDRMVPERPVRRLTDIAPVLIVEADSSVVPLTHEVDRTLALGSLARARLTTLAHGWLDDGQGDRLAEACERTWLALTAARTCPAFYWYDEVAARTRSPETVAAA